MSAADIRYEVAIIGGGIIDLATAMALTPCVRGSLIVREAGGVIQTEARVERIRRTGDEILLFTEKKGEVRCRFLVNCGGLQSDRIARMSGVNPGLWIVPFRGEYYESGGCCENCEMSSRR